MSIAYLVTRVVVHNLVTRLLQEPCVFYMGSIVSFLDACNL